MTYAKSNKRQHTYVLTRVDDTKRCPFSETAFEEKMLLEYFQVRLVVGIGWMQEEIVDVQRMRGRHGYCFTVSVSRAVDRRWGGVMRLIAACHRANEMIFIILQKSSPIESHRLTCTAKIPAFLRTNFSLAGALHSHERTNERTCTSVCLVDSISVNTYVYACGTLAMQNERRKKKENTQSNCRCCLYHYLSYVVRNQTRMNYRFVDLPKKGGGRSSDVTRT